MRYLFEEARMLTEFAPAELQAKTGDNLVDPHTGEIIELSRDVKMYVVPNYRAPNPVNFLGGWVFVAFFKLFKPGTSDVMTGGQPVKGWPDNKDSWTRMSGIWGYPPGGKV